MQVNRKAILGYDVQKVVRIHDPKLWMINICLSILVVCYIFIVLIWKQGGYAVGYSVEGEARIKLYEPTINGCDTINQASSCRLNFPPKTSLIYCDTYKGVPANQLQKPCRIMSADTVQRRLPGSISVITSVTEYSMLKTCNQSLPNCDSSQNATSKTSYYVSGIEFYTLSIFHTVSYASSLNPVYSAGSSKRGYIGSSDQFPVGKLLVKNNTLCRDFPNTVDSEGKPVNTAPCFVLATKNPNHRASRDEFSLGTVLAVAGADLNSYNSGSDLNYRDSGMILTLQIVYSNFKEWTGISKVSFYYNPIWQERISYGYYDKIYTNYPQRYVLSSVNGILIQTVAVGTLYAYSFTQMVLTITSSMALLGLSTVVINNLFLKKSYDSNIKEHVDKHFRNAALQEFVEGFKSRKMSSRRLPEIKEESPTELPPSPNNV